MELMSLDEDNFCTLFDNAWNSGGAKMYGRFEMFGVGARLDSNPKMLNLICFT